MAKGVFVKFGQWVQVKNMTQQLANDILDENEKTLKKVALKAEGIAVKHLRDQDLKWTPLFLETLAAKASKGQSLKTLIATSTMFQSITTTVKGNKTSTLIAFTGVSKKIKNDDGEVVADIAKVHEFGSTKRNIPKRPLWKPTFKQTLKFVKEKNPFALNALARIRMRAN